VPLSEDHLVVLKMRNVRVLEFLFKPFHTQGDNIFLGVLSSHEKSD